MASYKGLSKCIDFDTLEDPSEKYALLEVIGEGTYGEVYSAICKETEQKVAVKILENIADNIEEIEEEYVVLRDLCMHPNIPVFMGMFLRKAQRPDDDQLWFVMELCSGGSVTDLAQGYIRRAKRMPETHVAYILKETIQVLNYLHQNNCMHRDVKGHNILLTDDAEVKLVDFGVSYMLEHMLGKRNTSVGTPYWMAPEVIACEQQFDCAYDIRCDVWSLGITAIELADGDPPLADVHPMRALFQIPRNPPPELKKPASWSLELNDFISECLVKDYEQRPLMEELIEHPFITQIPNNTREIQEEIKKEINRQCTEGRVKRKPEVTTKHGKLKTDRKSELKSVFVDDLAALEHLAEDIVVEQLMKRYEDNQIYTYMGDILLAINPFKRIDVYNHKEMERYQNSPRCDNPPHIYAVADAGYHSMLHQRQNQCVVISGESAAGKTESANLLVKQLVHLGRAPNRSLEEQILAVNPIMEAFGNAKTGLNDNSSRFAKFLDLTFTKSGKITGAKVSVYLLEQSRVVRQQVGEQNFHMFYYLYDGLEHQKELQHYSLDASTRDKHNYLRNSKRENEVTQNNINKLKEVQHGFQLLGFTDEEVDSVYRIVATILHLGDISFCEGSDSSDNTDCCTVQCMSNVETAAKLLGVAPEELSEAFIKNSVVTRGEIITRNNTKSEAEMTRDTMAKVLYARLFDWIVIQINRLLSFGHYVYSRDTMLAVGLLDIFGFENFSTNSFEQLCINIANEQIQYYFNQHIFSWEQQEYMAEGVMVDVVEFSDNRPVLDMFLSKPLGLLALLDEESRFPKATDSSFVEKLNNNVRSPFYIKSRSNPGQQFLVQHYAGRVRYDSKMMLEKNRNFLAPEIIQLLRQSSYDTLRFLFQCPLTKTGNLYSASPNGDGLERSKATPSPGGLASQTRAQQTVATYFRYSLMDLLHKMVSGVPHFVRCIKPNDTRSADSFDRDKVLIQLQYTGVMETVRIRQQGFSHRMTFADFLKRYCFLAYGFDERVIADREHCRLLLVRLKMDGWAIGKSKVFLKYYHVEYLSRVYEEQINKIIKVQALMRGWLVKMKIKKAKNENVSLQQMLSEPEPEILASPVHKVTNAKVDDLIDRLEVKSPEEMHRELVSEGVPNEVAVDAIQKRWQMTKKRCLPRATPAEERTPTLELSYFAQEVHMSNQEAHMYLRTNNRATPLKEIQPTAKDFKIPSGFVPAKQRSSIKRKAPTPPKSQPALKMTAGRGDAQALTYADEGPFMPWDAPILIKEDDVADRRRKSRGMIDLTEYRDQLLQEGLITQSKANVQRSDLIASKFKQITKGTADQTPMELAMRYPHQQPAPKPGSEVGQPVGFSAAGLDVLEQHWMERQKRRPSQVRYQPPAPYKDRRCSGEATILAPPTHNGVSANYLDAVKKRQPPPAVQAIYSAPEVKSTGQSEDTDMMGPYNFRKLLRKTNNAPTDTLRRVKGHTPDRELPIPGRNHMQESYEHEKVTEL